MTDSVVTVVLAGLVPLVLVALTSFVKISTVLALLRNGFGTPDAPSAWVTTSVSLILTALVMAPVASAMLAAAESPAANQPSAPAPAPAQPGVLPPPAPANPPPASQPAAPSAQAPTAASATAGPASTGPSAEAMPHDPAAPPRPLASVGALVRASGAAPATASKLERAAEPLRGFLLRNTSAADRTWMQGLATELGYAAGAEDFAVVAPAFVVTELKEALAIAVLLLVPFLILDLIVGVTLAALGISSIPPQVVALPLKLVLFLAVDGWRLLVEGLVRGYA